MTINETRSQSIKRQYENTCAALNETQSQLDRATHALSEGRLNAILTGKPASSDLATAVIALQQKLTELSESIQPLESAYQLVLQNEAAEEVEARAARVESLRAEYKNRVKAIVDAAAQLAAVQHEADQTYLQLTTATGTYVPRVFVALNLCDDEGFLRFASAVCSQGYADVVPPENRARIVYEHGQAHDARRFAEAEADRQRRLDAIRANEELQKMPAVSPSPRQIKFQGGSY